MAGGFVFVGKSRLRKLRRETRKTKKLEVKKKNPLGGSGEWSPQSQKFKYAPLLSARDDTDNISVCSTDSAISSGSDEDFLPLIDLRPQPTAFTMPFGPFKKSKELEEKKRKEEEAEKERQRLEEEERLRKEEEERIRLEEEERLRKEEEERLRKEEEDRLAEEQRLEEEKKKAEAEAEAKKKKPFGFTFLKKSSKEKEKSGEKENSQEKEKSEQKENGLEPVTEDTEKVKEEEMENKSDNKTEEDILDGKAPEPEDENVTKGTDIFSFSFIDKLRQLGKGNEPENIPEDKSSEEEINTEENQEVKNEESKTEAEPTEKKEESAFFSMFRRLGQSSEEEKSKSEGEEGKGKEEEQNKTEEEKAKEEEEKQRRAEEEDTGIFGIALFKSKFLKPKEETSEKDPLTAPVEEAKEPEVQTQSDVAKTQTTLEEEKVEELCEKNEDDTKSLDSGIESHKNGIDTDEQDGLKPQKVEKAKVAEEDRECTEMLCCTIM